MDDLELTKLCAEAMGLTQAAQYNDSSFWYYEGGESVLNPPRHIYSPLTNDAQAMALVKKLDLSIDRGGQRTHEPWWGVRCAGKRMVHNADLNRAIVECVARMTKAKQESGEA